MDQKKAEPRGVPLSQYRLWKYSIEKEDNLRLKWFKKNEERLDEIANKIQRRKVPDEVMQEMKERMLKHVDQTRRCVVPPEEVPPLVEEAAIHSIMRPVDRAVTALIYANTMDEGRRAYLRERCKLIPEQRYYFPEVTSFQYGWNMWELMKNTRGSKFARQQVIKESFYRRRGVNRDPEWYKEPARLSPQVCGQM